MVRDPDSGKYRRTRLFVLTLGYSRKAVRLLVQRSSAQVWAQLHERAFRRLGGTVRVVVLDNLKEGVLTPDIYDPALNPLYRDVLAHYGIVALPCRVRDPDRKGKVEAAVGHAQKTPLRGLRFERLDDGQAYLDRWEQRWADTRIHGTTKRRVAAMFEEERPALGPLPSSRSATTTVCNHIRRHEGAVGVRRILGVLNGRVKTGHLWTPQNRRRAARGCRRAPGRPVPVWDAGRSPTGRSSGHRSRSGRAAHSTR